MKVRKIFDAKYGVPFDEELIVLMGKDEFLKKNAAAIRALLADLTEATGFYLEKPREARQLLVDSKMVRATPDVYIAMNDYYHEPTMRIDVEALEDAGVSNPGRIPEEAGRREIACRSRLLAALIWPWPGAKVLANEDATWVGWASRCGVWQRPAALPSSQVTRALRTGSNRSRFGSAMAVPPRSRCGSWSPSLSSPELRQGLSARPDPLHQLG
jgi:hypothetical protein